MVATEKIDYVGVNRQTMVDFHGKYTFLEVGDNLYLFETGRILELGKNPITDNDLTNEELEYVRFHNECYRDTRDMELSPETLQKFFTWYSDSRKAGVSREVLRDSPDTQQAYNIVRYYLTATDFQSHFRDFDPTDSDKEAYERDLAEKALRESGTVGTWLLRHSSRNRPVGKEAQDRLQKLGYRYYALTYVARDNRIHHVLITMKVGKGFSICEPWQSNFLDVLEQTLTNRRLSFQQRIHGYV